MQQLRTAAMRLPDEAHTSRPWRIHDLAPDFRVEDVWGLPATAGPEDFPRMVDLITRIDPTHRSPAPVRALFALRWKLGELFGWDDETADGPSLRDRVPAELREAHPLPRFDAVPFESLYLLDDEFAAETANRTMHGVLHLGWVPDGQGSYRGQMAVLVKRNGAFGAAYMAAIRPFRHLIVYPLLTRQVERAWSAAQGPRRP